MYVTYICGVTLLLSVLTLRNTQIYIFFSDCSNILFYAEAFIDKAFHFHSSLWIPNVNPYYGYIKFERGFDYVRL